MKKDNILFGVIGLLIGLITGFYVTNKLNASISQPQPVVTANQPANSGQQQLPKDHPAPDSKNAGAKSAGPLPQIQEAIDAAKNQPNNFEAQMKAGDLYYQIQNFDEAVNFYTAANKLKPEDDKLWLKLGNVEYDAGKLLTEQNKSGNAEFGLAEKWYENYLNKNPDDVNARTDLGVTFCLRQPPDYDRGIKEFQTSLEKNPNHEPTLQNLAFALGKKGDSAALQDVIERIRRINPGNATIPQDTTPSN